MAVAQKANKLNLTLVIALGTIVSLFFGGVSWVFRGVQMTEQLADKKFVEASLIEGKHYTDEKIELIRKEGEQIRKDAYEHSDTNRQFMMLKIEEMNGKMTNSTTALATKVDMLILQLQNVVLDEKQAHLTKSHHSRID